MWLILVLKVWVICVNDCLSLVYYRMLVFVLCCSRGHIYIWWCLYRDTSLHIYICTHIPAVGWWKGVRRRKRVRERKSGRGRGNGMLQLEFLFLSNFMIAKGLFDVNMKCLFCGEFCWVMIMKIKIIIA